MQLLIGQNYFDKAEQIIYDTAAAENCHWLVLGASGTGKTHFLRRLVDNLKIDPRLRIHIFDSQGDIFTDPQYSSSVRFSESSIYGINPFQIIADADFGGVRKRINSFLSMVNRHSGKLGVRQETCLRNMLKDLYANFGFSYDDPSTWTAGPEKPFPTMDDLQELILYKLKSLVIGNYDKALEALNELSKATPKLAAEVNKTGLERDTEKIADLQESLIRSYSKYIKNIEKGTELDDFIRFDSREIIRSAFNRIESLASSGLFKNNPPSFLKRHPIWRYDICALSPSEKRFLIEIYLEKIFFNAQLNGLSDTPNTYIVIDECQEHLDEDPDHIVNQMIRQSRKYGVFFILASQNFKNMSEEILLNTANKLICGVDATHHDNISKKFGIKLSRIKAIQSRSTGLCQMKCHGTYLNNNYHSVYLS